VDFWIKFLSYINLAGTIHALIQSMVLLLTRRGNRRANRVMALFLMALAVGMANGVLSLLGLYEIAPLLVVFMGAIALAYGPLFYLYIRAMTTPDRPGVPADVLHGVPFLLGILVYGVHGGSPSGGPFLPGIIGWAVGHPWVVVTVMSGLQTAAYVALVIRLLRAYSARIKATFSTIDRINLVWLRRRLAVYAAIWVIALVMIAVAGFEGRALGLFMQIVAVLTALNIFATGYRAMRQAEVVLGPAAVPPGKRYERSSLSAESAAHYRSRLLELMEREKPHLDPELTLPKLAQALEVPVAHLSRVINEQFGRNFYEFINHYRVEEAKRRLAGPDAGRDKLITVALDCGFNSLATFNRVFKELAERTPSAYRQGRTAA